jgi:alpha-2-macroglobulin
VIRPSQHPYLYLVLLLALTLVGAESEAPYLYGGGSYSAASDVRLEYFVPTARSATASLYRIGNPEKALELGGPRDFRHTAELELERVRSLTIERGRQNAYGTLDFGRLGPGLYLAQLEGEADSSATLILVTDLGLVVKSDEESVVAYTADLPSGVPRKARLYLLRDGRLYAEGLADEDGLTRFQTESAADSVTVAAKFGDDWVFSESYWQGWNIRKAMVYLQTDRPVYRPGHDVYFKGTARSPSGLSPLAGEEVQVVVYDADNTEILSERFGADAYGSFAGELELGLDAPLGTYSLQATVEGETSYASFEVQAFRKPEYRVSVTPEREVAVQGETLRFTVAAEYLFGGAVAGGQVNYALLKQPYHRWRTRSSFGFYEDFGDGGYYGGDIVERGQGVLDENGEFIVEAELPRAEEDYRLVLQAGVTDEARREVSASGSAVAYRSEIVLDVTAERYAYEAGEVITLTVRAEDLQGRPVSVPFVLESERYLWHEGRQVEAGPSWPGRTDEDGQATVEIELAEQGSYGLTVRAEDAAGRETSAGSSLWVEDGSPWYWAYEGLSITADKEEYRVDDLARFVIASPVADVYALITHEGERLSQVEVVKLEGSVLTYELEITESMTPNGYLSVSIIGGGNYYLETAGFRVPPADKFLSVEITSDADRYRPGETGTFSVRVSDASGRGARAQLTLGLVDEAIYLVRPESTPDIRGFFYALRGNVVGTQLGAWYYFGQAAPMPISARAPMDEAVFAQGKADFAEAELRQDFRDTILWLPTLETNDEGLATAEVTFPDNLTEWRFTARAITLGDEVGQNVYDVMTTLPVIVRLAAPRFFIRGDEASLRVIGQSTLLEDQPGELLFEADGLMLHGPGVQDIFLPTGGRASADFLIDAETTGEAKVRASALTPEASDALELPLPVLPRGVREEVGWAGSGEGRWSFDLPADTDLTTARGTLYLTPSLAAAVSPALSFLAGFPYGCTEQTMSRFLPSVLAARAGELARLPEDVAQGLDEMVQAGLARLYDFQHDDGGWGFWQHDASSPFISAYVVSGLLEAREAGYRVRENVLERGLSYLQEVVTPPTPPIRGGAEGGGVVGGVVDADAKAYAYYALARVGRDIDGLGAIVGVREMSPYGLALSVLAFAAQEREVEANLYLDLLLSRVTERERVAYWEPGAPRYFWNDDRVEATAYGLEALARLRPDEPLIAKIVNWLLLERRGARWVSTKDTAAVVKAALVLAERTGEAAADYQVGITLNGQELGLESIQGQAARSLEIPLEGFQVGRNRLELEVEGSGSLYASAAVSYVSERDYLSPEAQGIVVTRKYEALSADYLESERRYVYTPAPLTGESAVGDYVLVTVTIEPEQGYRYVLVNEPLPAGYSVVEDDQAFRVAGRSSRYGDDYYGWNQYYDGREIHDERVDYYFSYLDAPVTFTYILRAETPGRYTALPTQAWLMYEPEVRGVGVQGELDVAAD